MTIQYVTGDATDPIGDGPKLIAHIVNDRGWWGRGFVMAVSDRWPDARKSYQRWFQDPAETFLIGMVQFVSVGGGTEVANMVGQHGVRTAGGVPPIRYAELERCLGIVGRRAVERRAAVHMPRIGCGLAGGTWDRVEPLIVEKLCGRGISVTVYDLP